MRVLGVGARVELLDLYLSLMREGHGVRVVRRDGRYGTGEGMVDFVEMGAGLEWVGRDGVVVFERVGEGAAQERLRAEGYRVIGGSVFGDRLELDREAGQAAMRGAGMRVAAGRAFGGAEEAAAWLRANPGRVVLKHFDNARATFVGEHRAGLDVLHRLRSAPEGRVLLMGRLEGVEVGVGAYFDGARFLEPACIDFEHKRFFPGEIGEMTGEMGTLVRYRGAERLFGETLGRMEAAFRAAGHVGYVNLNMIVDEEGVWPLEFTCRFGNPGYCILAPLQGLGWGELFERMVEGGHTGFETSGDWCVGVVLTVPPFPGELMERDWQEDPPVLFHDGVDEEAGHYHWSDVRGGARDMLAGRGTGYVGVVTGVGGTIEAAQAGALRRARGVCVPELRYRGDIGERVRLGEAARLQALGWMGG